MGAAAEVKIFSQISFCHPSVQKSPFPLPASRYCVCSRSRGAAPALPWPQHPTGTPRAGAEGVNDKKKFIMYSQCSLSAGISEAEFDKMAAAKFSMCRLEVKCN